MAKLVQYLISTILIVPYVLSHIAPRREDLWVFGADKGDSFTGNPKYEFLYVSNNVERITAVWITDDPDVEEELRARGYSVRRRSTVGAKVVTLRAGVAFLSHELRDVVWWCTGGATIVQLWHGVSFKEKGWITREKQGTSILPVKLFKQYVILNYDYFITTSDNLEALHREAFWVPPERILPLGYPRHDVLFDEIPGEDLGFQDGYDRWTTGGDDTQVLYLPTWRDTGADRDGDVLTELSFTYTGSFDALVDYLDGFHVLELDVEEAPLEQVFMRFYDEDAAPGGSADRENAGGDV